jgi:mannosyltransferase OCH1-like enzyme
MVQDMLCHTVVPLFALDSQDIKIPRTIIQTSTTAMVNFKLYSACMSLVDQNPDFEYIFMDNQDIDDFVVAHYHPPVVELFRSVIPGAYKADLFRYMYLHIYGGFYFDCKIIAKAPILSVITAQDGDLIVCKDRPYGALYNAVIFARQGHPDLARALQESLSRLNELRASGTIDETNRLLCKYGIYGITGPALLWQVLSPQILEGTLLPRLLYSKSTNLIHKRTREKEPAYVHRPDVWLKEQHHSAIFLVPYYRDYYFDYRKVHGDISYKEHFFQKTILHK